MDLYAAIDRLVASVGEKYTNAVHGKLLTSVGSLSVNQWGQQLSLAIRQRKGKKPHVQFSVAGGGESQGFEIPCSREWAEQLERLAQEMRKQIDSEAKVFTERNR